MQLQKTQFRELVILFKQIKDLLAQVTTLSFDKVVAFYFSLLVYSAEIFDTQA